MWATRLSTSKPFYIKQHGTWVWNRYAAATIPALPTPAGEVQSPVVPARKNRIRIPWPKGPKTEKAKRALTLRSLVSVDWLILICATCTLAGPYDTLPEDALEITWAPYHPKDPVDFSRLEHLYIRSLHPTASFFNPVPRPQSSLETEPSVEEHAPMEYLLAAELSNPHSRAKKQKRWQEKQVLHSALKDKLVTVELERARKTGPNEELSGRRVKPSEAKRIAEWKWKNEIVRREKQDKHTRWVASGGLENKKRRQIRGARKLRRAQERLRHLEIGVEKNQVVPPTRQ